MPKVLSYTPEWLARPSPGFDLFASRTTSKRSDTSKKIANRRLAHRGTEVFIANGSDLRWGDLTLLEAAFYDEEDSQPGKGWRTLKAPVSQPIRQLCVSPDGNLIAIVTKHTCHVCILPVASHLRSGDDSVIRLKSFQVGPTEHVLEQAAIAACLWHPLSAPGLQCLVTVTADACVRMWELDATNRYSFGQPELAVDLKKLANATTTTSDFSASKFGRNRGFSPDDVEMEVAAACFGGYGWDDEYGWASMTLWVAMAEGDIYALCPFLPSRFRLSSSTLPSLSTGVIAERQILFADEHALEVEQQTSDAQSRWLGELDAQDPLLLTGQDEFDIVETYARPTRLGAMPRLQGPFQFSTSKSDLEITDIFAIASTVDDAELFDEDIDEGYHSSGLSVGILCLATTSGEVHVCLNLDGVQAQWLPLKKSRAFTLNEEVGPTELLLLQTAALPETTSGTSCCPSFTWSSIDRYEVLVTSSGGVYNLDFKPWAAALEDELASQSTAGVDFRFKTFLSGLSTVIQPLIVATGTDDFHDASTAVAFTDADLGNIVLVATQSGPHAVVLSTPQEPSHLYEAEVLALREAEPRQSYQPSNAFYTAGQLTKLIEARRANPVTRAELSQPMKSKPDSLQLLTDTHRVLSDETHRLGVAVAELFRQCERMCSELADQVTKVDEISQKVTTLTEVGTVDGLIEGEDLTVDGALDQRIIKVQSNASNMNERLEKLRRRMLHLGGEALSTKERAFVQEVQSLHDMTAGGTTTIPIDPGSILSMPDHEEAGGFGLTGSMGAVLTNRLNSVMAISDELLAQTQITADRTNGHTSHNKSTSIEYKKQKLDRVLQLMDRENALMEAVSERFAKLNRPT